MRPGRRPGRVKAAAVIVLALLLAPGLGQVSAAVVWKEDAGLPHAWFSAGWAWTGTYGYTFGNADLPGRSSILRIDPDTLQVTTMGATLPNFQRAYQATAWDGTYVYLFGGVDGPDTKDRAIRYHPATDTRTVLPALLPGGRDHATAAYDPRVTAECPAGCIYIVGGLRFDESDGAYTFYDRIVRYDPAGDVYTTLDAKLPTPLTAMSSAFDGETLWLFGGQNTVSESQDDIYAFDPLTEELRESAADLPSPRYGIGTLWNGSAVILAGGRKNAPYHDDIWAFDPATETLTDLGVRMPTGRWGSAVFPKGDGVLVVGGMQYSPGNKALPDILRYDRDLAPPPASLVATPGPGRGEVTLTFDASSDPTVTGYEVHLLDGTLVASLTSPAPVVDLGAEGVVREYRVRSVNAAGPGPYGPVASAMPPGLPGAPTSLATARGPQPGDVRLTWSAPAFDGGSSVVAYRVYGGDASGVLAFLGETASRTFTDHGVATGATRWYRVTAVNSPGEGPASLEVTGQPPTLPGTPGTLRAAQGLQRIDLSWSRPASDGGTAVTGYVVYRGEPGAETRYATVGNVLSWSDTGRAGFVTYSYRVAAVNGVGEGAAGNAASASALGPMSFKTSLDGTVVVFDDADDDNEVDPGEAILVVPLLP